MPVRVTVVIATYNWSSVLPFSIGSVLDQTFRDFELLVVGDGCTDDSAAVVAGIADPRVRWINLPVNSGHQSGPNNEGLRQASGDLVAYLGHDDLWFPHHLAAMVDAFDRGADVATTIVAKVMPDGSTSPLFCAPAHFGDWMPPSGIAHRKEVADRAGCWRAYRDLDMDPETDLRGSCHPRGSARSTRPWRDHRDLPDGVGSDRTPRGPHLSVTPLPRGDRCMELSHEEHRSALREPGVSQDRVV